MNKFKKLSAIILAVCTMATVFYSCGNNDKPIETTSADTVTDVAETEIVTEIETVKVEVTDKKGNVSVSVSEKIVTLPVTKKETAVKTEKDNTPAKLTTTKKTDKSDTAQVSSAVTQISSAITTVKTPLTTKKSEVKTTKAPIITVATTKKQPVVDDKINENSVGIFMLSKTDPIQVGSQANIVIKGTPGKTYSIEFYETPSLIAKMNELDNQKADANGFVTWTFEIRNTCNLGKRKVIIKEINSDNYIETSITVK